MFVVKEGVDLMKVAGVKLSVDSKRRQVHWNPLLINNVKMDQLNFINFPSIEVVVGDEGRVGTISQEFIFTPFQGLFHS